MMGYQTVRGGEGDAMKLNNAVSEIRKAPGLDVSVWCAHGQEHYHRDIGEYWKPAHIKVTGDMKDMATLRVLNHIMDKYGLKVHTKHGVSFSGDDYARLVLSH